MSARYVGLVQSKEITRIVGLLQGSGWGGGRAVCRLSMTRCFTELPQFTSCVVSVEKLSLTAGITESVIFLKYSSVRFVHSRSPEKTISNVT